MSVDMVKVQSLIENAFMPTIEKLAKNESGNFIGDLYVQANAESGGLRIYDDEEHLIEKIVIPDWMDSSEEENAFNKRVVASAKAVLTILSTRNASDVPRFTEPLSVSLTDEDLVVIEELLFIDDDTLRLDDPSLKNLDADLDDFLTGLLTDIK